MICILPLRWCWHTSLCHAVDNMRTIIWKLLNLYIFDVTFDISSNHIGGIVHLEKYEIIHQILIGNNIWILHGRYMTYRYIQNTCAVLNYQYHIYYANILLENVNMFNFQHYQVQSTTRIPTGVQDKFTVNIFLIF